MARSTLFVVMISMAVGLACKSAAGGGDSDAVVTPSTYVATSGEGDLALWTVADGDADVTTVVTPVDQFGNPIDDGVFTVRGTCTARNTTFD